MPSRKITMIDIDSSNLNAYGWKDDVLQVEFRNGKKAQYDDVPEEVWEAFQAADSKGSFFYNEIRMGGYAWKYVR